MLIHANLELSTEGKATQICAKRRKSNVSNTGDNRKGLVFSIQQNLKRPGHYTFACIFTFSSAKKGAHCSRLGGAVKKLMTISETRDTASAGKMASRSSQLDRIKVLL